MAVVSGAPNLKSMQDFRSTIGNGRDMSKISRFLVRIGRFANDEEMMYMCDSAEIPGRTLETFPVRYYGPQFKLPNNSAYTDINLNFIVRDTMIEKEKFDQWMQYIHPKNTYDFKFLNQYSCDIDIYQYSEIQGIGATYQCTLTRAYPIAINPMQTNWAEEGIHRLQVSFSYTDWVTFEEKQLNQASIVTNSAAQTGSFGFARSAF